MHVSWSQVCFCYDSDTAIVHLAERLAQKAAKFNVQGVRWRIPCRNHCRLPIANLVFGLGLLVFEDSDLSTLNLVLCKLTFRSPSDKGPKTKGQGPIGNWQSAIGNYSCPSLPIASTGQHERASSQAVRSSSQDGCL